MISVPVGTGDIADAMISASQMKYASRMKRTDIISYRASDISLKRETNETSYWLKLMFETKKFIYKHINTQKNYAAIFADC